MHASFNISQQILLVSSEGKFLALGRDGKLMLPGGRLEEGEGWEEGLRREIQEETGLTDFEIEKVGQVGITDDFSTYVVLFVGKVPTTEVSVSSEHTEAVWILPEEIDSHVWWHVSFPERIRAALK